MGIILKSRITPERLLVAEYHEKYGPVRAWGIIQDRSGNVITQFDVTMSGRWEGNKGVLDKVFTYYESGKTQNRTWEITRIDDRAESRAE